MRGRHTIAVLAAAVLLLAGLTWRDRDPGSPLRALVPRLDPEVARALATGDGDRLANRLRDRGTEVAAATYGLLRDGLGGDPAEPCVDRRADLLPAMARLADYLAREYLLPEYQADVDYWRQAEPDQVCAVARRYRHLRDTYVDGSADPDSVRAALEEELAWFRDVAYPYGISKALESLAINAIKRGQPAESRAWFEQQRDVCQQHELRYDYGAALCSLALHDVTDADGHAPEYIEEALALARESRFASLAARANAVAGVYAHEQGRFALGCDRFEEAVRVTRELGQPAIGLPSLVTLMRFYATYGDWDRVEELLPQARLVLAEAQEEAREGPWPDPTVARDNGLRIRELEARTLLARGRVEEAEAIYPALLAATRNQRLQETAYTYDYRCKGLLSAGRADLAAAAAESALAHAESVPLPRWAARSRLHAARAHYLLGDREAAQRELDEFLASVPRQRYWTDDLTVHAEALRARLLRDGGDPARGIAALTSALADLVATLDATDASSRAYLELDRADDLRRALQELLGTADRDGYGIELLWRRLPGWLGGNGQDGPQAGEDLTARMDDLVREMQAWLGRRDAIHLLYRQERGRLLRWAADGTAVRCDTLAVTAAMLGEQVTGVLRLLGTDPGERDAVAGAELAARTRDLAEMLLPAALLSSSDGPRLIVVSSDGALALVPFTVLNVATPPAYRPLLTFREVARMRGSGSAAPARPLTHGLVVAAPEVAPRLRRRHPGLAELSAGRVEAARVASLLPAAEVLEGAAATRLALLEAWQRCDCLYFACHTVRHPEMPYRTFLPLSAAGDGRSAVDAALLDVVDIRAHDLSHLQLVVLASCASGAPYVASGVSAPSLADAFLDAGVSATVQTLWRVRDEGPARLLETCLHGWREEGLSLPAALARAQREAMARPDRQVNHPFGWAVFEVNLRGP